MPPEQNHNFSEPQNMPPKSPTPTLPQSRGQKTAVWLLSTVVVVLIAVVGWLVYRADNPQPAVDDTRRQTATIPSNWTIYRDSAAGFSFLYPPDWRHTTSSLGAETFAYVQSPDYTEQVRNAGELPFTERVSGISVFIYTQRSPSVDSIEELLEISKLGRGAPACVFNAERITTSGYYPALLYDCGGYSDDTKGHQVELLANNHLISITMEYKESKDRAVFDTLLSSLQIESVASSQIPADWKTYRNEEYGFTFKYPSSVDLKSFSAGGVAYFEFSADQIEGNALPVSVELFKVAAGEPCNAKEYAQQRFVAGEVQWEREVRLTDGIFAWQELRTHMSARDITTFLSKTNPVCGETSAYVIAFRTGEPTEIYNTMLSTFRYICRNGATNYPRCNADLPILVP